ncbi:OmpA family protein [Shinella zoogloeoides]|uniref:OmpA family protein n=1 Tax=Shinella zoogloeoides TaxID=352475 RepID=UPI0028B18B48|nr:OmpA family protein [Shinella zoogloeoides]
MTFRSRLFATVALPLLSASLIATPSLADALSKPFEVAQESSDEGQPSEEELLLLKKQQEEQRQAEEQQRQAEEQQKAAEDQQRAAEQEAQRQAEEQKAAEESAQPAAEEEQPRAERKGKKRHQQEQQSEEQQPSEEQNAVGEDTQRQAEESAQPAEEEQQRPKTERKGKKRQQQTEEQQPAEEQNADTQRQAEEQKAGEESVQPAEGEQRSQKERKGKKRQQQEQQQTEGQQPTEEQPAMTGEGTPAETEGQPSTAEQPADAEQQPATAEDGEATGRKKAPAVVETLSEEQKQEIAADPSKTDETVVLPVENGAAVLDSDKDADNAGGQKSRDQRRKKREELRAEEEAAPMPESDMSAQAPISDEVREALPQRIDAAIKEKGERLDAAPVFEVPQTTNVINNTVINNTVVNNNTVNNNVTHVNVVEKVDNRMVLSIGNQLVVRGDDRERLRHDSEEVYYDNLARGRVRETIVRPGGVRLVTIYNRYGDIIQRSRIGRDGDEHILVYAPDLGDDAPRPDFVDVGYELPPMRLRIPVRDYIIDTSSNPDRDYYDFLAEPPVERVERVYTIDEVKNSARLRDKVRRIDLDTITFATGSAEVPMSQARTLRKVADAMQKVLDKDPGETFLIEGHTDAVGSDKSNLILSDERAESVASLLTDVYGIPPENLQTQGYGERFLKVRTQSAEQQNRRVTIRRVTTLVRPVAQN